MRSPPYWTYLSKWGQSLQSRSTAKENHPVNGFLLGNLVWKLAALWEGGLWSQIHVVKWGLLGNSNSDYPLAYPCIWKKPFVISHIYLCGSPRAKEPSNPRPALSLGVVWMCFQVLVLSSTSVQSCELSKGNPYTTSASDYYRKVLKLFPLKIMKPFYFVNIYVNVPRSFTVIYTLKHSSFLLLLQKRILYLTEPLLHWDITQLSALSPNFQSLLPFLAFH